jgi:hypothetical protein
MERGYLSLVKITRLPRLARDLDCAFMWDSRPRLSVERSSTPGKRFRDFVRKATGEEERSLFESKTRFAADDAGTPMTMRMTLPDAQTRAALLATGMEHGMEASYVRLERMSGWKA